MVFCQSSLVLKSTRVPANPTKMEVPKWVQERIDDVDLVYEHGFKQAYELKKEFIGISRHYDSNVSFPNYPVKAFRASDYTLLKKLRELLTETGVAQVRKESPTVTEEDVGNTTREESAKYYNSGLSLISRGLHGYDSNMSVGYSVDMVELFAVVHNQLSKELKTVDTLTLLYWYATIRAKRHRTAPISQLPPEHIKRLGVFLQ